MQSDFLMLDIICPMCGDSRNMTVSRSAYIRWRNGTLIQDAFPSNTAEEREAIKTGYCQACWDRMFPKEDANATQA